MDPRLVVGMAILAALILLLIAIVVYRVLAITMIYRNTREICKEIQKDMKNWRDDL